MKPHCRKLEKKKCDFIPVIFHNPVSQKMRLCPEFRGPSFVRGDRLPALGVSSLDRGSWVCA